MLSDDHCLREAIEAVLTKHGDEAIPFAAERLSFCLEVSFNEGETLWRAIHAGLCKRTYLESTLH